MKSVVTTERQTIFDIAIQACGSVNAAYDIALLNNMSVSDIVAPGSTLTLPEVLIQDIVTYYADKNLHPATDVSDVDNENVLLEGIGYWTIGVDFIVS